MKCLLFILLVLFNQSLCHHYGHENVPRVSTRKSNPDEKYTKYWQDKAKDFVNKQIRKNINTNIAKNIILFIGDGMSIATLAAAHVYMGGEEKQLSFEKFPYTGLVRTYCVDKKVPDSACTSTAYLTGIKGNYGTIAVNGQVKRSDCYAMLNTSTYSHSIAKHAIDAGKSAGFVTTTRVTHASPAGIYAHTSERKWECDSDVKCKPNLVSDIADQLINGEVGRRLKVILGGGRAKFLSKNEKDEESKSGERSDGLNLIKKWIKDGKKRTYVYNREQLMNVNPQTTDRLLGLFDSSHMEYNLEVKSEGRSDQKPTLAEMTKKAIQLLETNDKGYFLFVEGGKIDLAHHDVYANLALDETLELSKAVEIATKMTNRSNTLIVVSSDHSHTMSFSGYPGRNQDILKAVEISKKDNLPYMTLNYANGPAFHKFFDYSTNKRIDPRIKQDNIIRKVFPSTLPIDTETHGGEDVVVFANGPWSHLFTGTYDQNTLPHLLAYAACIGDGFKACD